MEEKRERKAKATAAAATEHRPKSKPNDSMSFVYIHLTYLLDAIPVQTETNEEWKECKGLKTEKKRTEAALYGY